MTGLEALDKIIEMLKDDAEHAHEMRDVYQKGR